jgi:hypothetical protein
MKKIICFIFMTGLFSNSWADVNGFEHEKLSKEISEHRQKKITVPFEVAENKVQTERGR